MKTEITPANLYTLGLDGGGSKTIAVILDQTGQLLGRGHSGSANHYQVGLEQVKANLLAAMEQAAEQASLALSQITAVIWALAGVGRPAERQLFKEVGSQLLPNVPLQIEHDALAALVGGLGSRQGVVLIAGTGMIAYGENEQGEQARAGGWGPLIDQAGGYRLAQAALQTICQLEDDPLFSTSLTGRVLEQLGLEKVGDLVGWLYDPKRRTAEIAALAPLVLSEAEAGDWVAVEIAAQTAAALAESVEAVLRRLKLTAQPTSVVLTGSLLTRNHFYYQVVAQAIQTRSPYARPMLPREDAAIGAALLAFETLGHDLPALKHKTTEVFETSAIWTSEQPNILTRDLDIRPTLTLAGLMHTQDRQAVAAVRPILPLIAEVIDEIARRMSQGGRLIYAGAGTSGRLGILDASECPPTFNTDPGQVIGLMAGGAEAITGAVEGAEDDAPAGAHDLAHLKVGPADSVVGLAASGRTPYIRGALEEARRRDALTVAVVCNVPAPVAEAAHYVIAPLVGPEIITGSTRLKAGTVQKLILNMLSSGVMVRLGKTYGNLMVDVQQTNQKLQARARRIVARACGLSEAEAAAALAESRGNVKVAIVSRLAHCSPAEAQKRLNQAGGVVRAALARTTPTH
jgi:N-acetylmuramic acid 6-phosphate etherase